ncbi:MAG: SMC family ATPase [Anaerolineae bacterium]|jgi:exonuclease SbcC|nr:SMC family ATPase [Anaerolineae bacterium]MDH7475012.1 SMC family ATPase [Anaerolineae bacterium]
MFPLKLRLHNFMCYRDPPPLDFTGIHLACLAGDNGHGKSALLDAMTWALWGRARGGARHDDELIHMGQTEMEVELEFALGSDRYRIIRKRDSRGKGQSTLELQGWDGSKFVPLTEPTIRDTQARIDNLLRMDYDTFINSAFLLQGRADEFTIKPPGERKRVLAEILGLGMYDEYEERAKELAKNKARDADLLAVQIAEIDQELARQPQYEADLRQAEADVARLNAELQTAEAELRTLREERKSLELQRQQVEDLTRRLAEGERELADLDAQIAASQARLDEFETLLTRQQEIEAGYSALLEARKRLETLSAQQDQIMALSQRREDLQRKIDQARHELEKECSLITSQVNDWEAKVKHLATLEQELAEVQARLQYLAEQEIAREDKQAAIQKHREEMATLRAQNEQLKTEMKSLEEKIELLRRSAEARCPLCGQGLSPADRDRLVGDFAAEGTIKGDAYRANQEAIRERTAQIETLEKELERLNKELATQAGLQRQAAALEQRLNDARQAQEQLQQARIVLETLTSRLEKGDYALEEQEQLAEAQAQFDALGYDHQAREQALRDQEQLAHFEKDKLRLDEALGRIDGERGELVRLRESRTRKQVTLAADQAHRDHLREAVARLPQVQQREREQEVLVEASRAAESRARQELGAARQRLEACRVQVEERKRKREAEQKARAEQAIYEELRTAFGKRGVQAMIIESAIPEIEDEANRLLARMTDGRMHVQFETQRDTKKGDTIETLDINISDELGTRSYALFSGGESFRVNLAIRIALSKLLARRAGARLQTLVIDEGFGTQDAQGRERLVEAINSIKDDFERVLVITHLEELKDAFPVRIDVVKTPQGSQFSIM